MPRSINSTSSLIRVPSFVARLGGDQSVTNDTKINFSSLRFATNDCYDTTNKRFNAPVSGYYSIGINIRFGATSSLRVVTVAPYKNGSVVSGARLFGMGGTQDYDGSSGNDHPYLSGETILRLDAGDYIEMYFSNEISFFGSLTAQASNSSSEFYGKLVQF